MSLLRTRWAALGAAVAITLGAGGIALNTASATTTSGDRLVYHPLTPCRIIDTRPEFQVGPRGTPLGAEDTIDIDGTGTTGNCTIPGDATALALNLTALDATLPTFLTVWATGEPLPLASAMNPAPNQPPIPNAVTTDLGTGGQFSIYNQQGNVHVFADTTGYYTHHTHDDRYYTKQQTDDAIAEAVGADAPRWVPLDPAGFAVTGGAGYESSSPSGAGLIAPYPELPQYPVIAFGTILPADMPIGGQYGIEIFWRSTDLPCDAGLALNHIRTTRLGAIGLSTPLVEIPYISLGGIGQHEVVRWGWRTDSEEGYRPGDIVSVSLWRSPSTTCPDEISIVGARLTYG